MNMAESLSISSLVIALTALFFTIWQAYITRQHNKLSIKPHLTIWKNEDFNNKYLTVELKNNGIGPALIKDFIILVDNEIISGNGTEPIKKAVKLLFPDCKYKLFCSYMGTGFSFGAKESCEIVAITFSPETSFSEGQIELAFTRADIMVEYESFYGESYKFDSREEKSLTS